MPPTSDTADTSTTHSDGRGASAPATYRQNTAGTTQTVRRRALLAVGATSLAALAGCFGDNSDNAGTDDTGDDTGTDNGDDTSTDNGDDTSTDTGGENGTGNGNDDSTDTGNSNNDSTDTGTDDGDDTPVASLSNVHISGQHDEVSIDVGADEAVSAIVTNEAETTREFTVSVMVRPDPGHVATADPDPIESDTVPLPLEPEASDTVTFGGLTPDLEEGRYEVVVRVAEAEHRMTLDVFGINEVEVSLYEHEVSPSNALGGWTATASADGTDHDTAVFDQDGVATLALPLGQTTTYTLDVTHPTGGRWPDTTVEATFERPGDTAEVVVGHPFSGTDSYRFSCYAFDETGFSERSGAREYFQYGTDMTGLPARDALHHHVHYMERHFGPGLWGEPTQWPPESPEHIRHIEPPEFGTDLWVIREEHGGTTPNHSVTLNGEDDFYYNNDGWWVWSETGASWSLHETRVSVLLGLDIFAGWVGGERAFYGTDEVRGTPVNVYEVPEQAAFVYVDPETGYVLRYEQVSLLDDFEPNRDSGAEFPLENSFVIAEFWDHDELDSLDWDVVKEYSNGRTGGPGGTGDLDDPPWEHVDK